MIERLLVLPLRGIRAYMLVTRVNYMTWDMELSRVIDCLDYLIETFQRWRITRHDRQKNRS